MVTNLNYLDCGIASPVEAAGTQHAFNSICAPTKNGEWEVRLPIPGHPQPDAHPTCHKTKEAADRWIASPDGRKWEEQKLAKYKKS
jgi:hypothetical protein